MMWGYYNGNYGGWMGLMMFGGAILFGLLIWFLVRDRGGYYHGPAYHPGPVQNQDDPMSILRRRLASGEITVEEYDRIRSTLNTR